MEATSPFDYLVGLNERARNNASPLPRQEEPKDAWTGMGFRLHRSDVLAPLDQLEEVLSIPPLTPIPGAKPWVRGIANVRGSLLPIMDLSGFLELDKPDDTPLQRVLVLRHSGIFAGLIVDQIWGLKHFFLDRAVNSVQAREVEMLSQMHPYIDQGYRDDEKIWPVFSLNAIAEDEKFLQVAK